MVSEQISKQLLNQMINKPTPPPNQRIREGQNPRINGFKVEPKESTSNKHFIFSILKSIIRIIGFLFLCNNKSILAGLILILAEFLGILEEF